MEEEEAPHLPLDIMYKIPKHISDPASLAHAASSCKLWCSVMKDSSFLDDLKTQHLDHDFITSTLLLGFFYQDSAEAPEHLLQHHWDKKHGAKLHTHIRILLVLYRHSNGTKGDPMPDVLSICNPLTGEVFRLPNLPYTPRQHYALLVTDDISLDERMTQFFHLVAIWTKGRTARYPDPMAGLYLVVSFPAAASDGAIHWLCGCWKSWPLSHVVTLQSLLLVNSADGGLLLLLMKGLHMSLWKHKAELANDDSSLPMQLITMHASANVKLEIFRGKSGVAVLWLVGEGLFMFSLGDRSMRKIHNEHVTKKYRFFPYEIDWLSCLAITNLITDGSLLLDAEREKAQRRWRALVVKNILKSTLS
ncbi:hypothetical protein BS78_01G032600 [Paspalum vaginatum]|nr:hypothetical protein BS78_01G032600 [Paspalum vaginatum]